MIVEQSQRLLEQIRVASDHEYAQRQVDELKRTRTSLQALENQLADFERRYRALSPYLNEVEQTEMQQRIAQIKSALASQSEALVKDRRAAILAMGRAEQQLNERAKWLIEIWSPMAQDAYLPYRTLFTILSKFNDLMPTLAPMREGLVELERRASRFPESADDVEDFFRRVQQMETILNNIEGLNEDIRSFLVLATSGAATLAHLTDDALAWCRQHADQFIILLK
jgi:cell fate (sporulation/competence/biofilm development) regulator YlbF (YheA/YmcA/DUF963 family)